MAQNSSRAAGRHFLQIPGPTPVPDRVLRAIDVPVIDHRGPEFAKMAKKALEGIKTIFKTSNPVIIYTATGTGAWEGALVNTLSAGDKVLMIETGQFATLWKKMAEKFGLQAEFIKTDWRAGADAAAIEAHLRKDTGKEIKAVCVVHNETSTGCASDIPAIRKAIDAAGHPALLMVDTISSLGSSDYRHDEWGVDVADRRCAEGPDAAARHVVQCPQPEGARSLQDLDAAEVVLRLGRHAQHEQGRLLPVHPGHADAGRSRRKHRACCTRKVSTMSSRAMTGWAKPCAAR